MKKKLLIGALGLASVFTLASATSRDGSSSETERRFWGSEIVGVASCVQTTPFPDGSPRFIKTWIVEYNIFWVGVSTSESEPIYAAHCGMP
ncbi:MULTISPECIES: hypothetical protein [unclassified Chryseobacterium]|uniref:hypothetical protein n=1 Tax=unclassified Chryseobacterium TaxID=2593645 RepID=UPI000D3D7BB6|nr:MULTISPECIES: hypothetical protein [unclassified Chryseobacterium]PTT74101.1 hypothetical protein DBR25_11595 [Chryseobacterium sp. HMWF001]PVV57998.1 hypothetical protein DD829_07775 [Chryseobacterium sp. HMWF035]